MKSSKIVSFLKQYTPFIVWLGYLIIFIEIYKYQGFIETHFHIALSIFALLTLVVLCIPVIILNSSTNDNERHIIFKINKVTLSSLILIWSILSVIEMSTYDNFVFSKFHVHISLIPIAIIYGVCIALIEYLPSLLRFKAVQILSIRNFTMKQLLKIIVLIILTLIMVNYILSNFVSTSKSSLNFSRFMFKHPRAPYTDKMREVWGVTFDFAEFIVSNTPENAVIAVPPRSNEYPTVGNKDLFRYLVYPRRLINDESGNASILPTGKYDYIVITKNFLPSDSLEYWPKVSIDTTEILTFDPNNHAISKVVNTSYEYLQLDNFQGWGLIRLNK